VSADVWLGSPEAALQFDIDGLSPDERARYEGIKGERRRREFAVSRALRRTALGSSSADPSQPSSLSHSGGWAAVARAAPGCQVGVDLEFHRPRNLLGIARFAFDPAEIAMIEAQPPQQQHEVFFALWTLKESMAKALGLPLLAAARQCVFTLDDVGVPDSDSPDSDSPDSDSPDSDSPDSNSMGVQLWRGQVPTDRPWLARVFRPRPDMALCVAVIGSDRADLVIAREWPSEKREEWRSVVALRNGKTV
jgi:hypothetical protein